MHMVYIDIYLVIYHSSLSSLIFPLNINISISSVLTLLVEKGL